LTVTVWSGVLIGMVRIVSFEPEHVDGVARLANAQGYPSYADPDSAVEILRAPGAYGLVALDDEAVVGFAHVSSNRQHAYLWTIVVAEAYRRSGIGRLLVGAAFEATGAERMDLLTVPESAAFYRSLRHQTFEGFRLYPEP
jgi:ribosomal protein S18 acetylase RimI-like enzyme